MIEKAFNLLAENFCSTCCNLESRKYCLEFKGVKIERFNPYFHYQCKITGKEISNSESYEHTCEFWEKKE